MLKEILNWMDEKRKQIRSDPNEKHPHAKAYGLAAIEGALDGVAIGAIISIVIIGIGKAINSKKK